MRIRYWLLAAATLAGVALTVLACYSPTPPPAATRTPPPSSAASSPTQTWRPAVKVDWKRYSPQARTRIDTHGQRHDCDALADELDAARKTDRALADYIDAWFNHSGLCIDVYHQKKK
jgi:hypothetical protein